MKIRYLTILTVLIAIFCVAKPALADDVVVQFENAPLPMFSEANFAPGNDVTRYIRVTNNLTEPVQAAILVNNLTTGSPDLAPMLNIVVKEGSSSLYTGTLRSLYDTGYVDLSSVPAGGAVQYDVTITFNSEANDEYQGATLQFDISLGLRSDAEQEYHTYGSTSGGGFGNPPQPTPTPTPSISPTPVPTVAGESTGYQGTGGRLAGGRTASGLVAGEESSPTPSVSASPSVSPSGLPLAAAVGMGGLPDWLWILLIFGAIGLCWWWFRRRRQAPPQLPLQ